MEKEIKNITSEKLLEIYNEIDNFVEFLNKEYKNTEKTRDSNE